MNCRPSAATVRAPAAFLKKMGSPPTPRNARTGELTPPGMYLQASWNRLIQTLLRQRRLRQTQPHLEAAAYTIARHGRAAVGSHDLGGDGQTNSLAAGVAIARFR